MIRVLKILTLSLVSTVLISACTMPKFGLPRVHRITIQQGNLVTQDMVDRLKPGMSKKQVAFVMGDPVVKNPFDDDRWDYVYTVFIQPNFSSEKRMSIFFVDEQLSHFTGDYVPSSENKAADAVNDADSNIDS